VSRPPVHLDETGKALHADRQSVYGDYRANMTGTSAQIDGMVRNWQENNPGKPLPSYFAALCQCVVKLNRIASGHFKQDNFDDLRVYLSFAEEMQRGEDVLID
jgi:hypothetical protein